MNCVKCGREIEQDQTFCWLCLEGMEAYPVKPGTVVHIPKHPDGDVEKKTLVRRKPMLTPEEQVAKLKRKVNTLRFGMVVLLLLCGALCFVVGQVVMELDFYRFLGKNYNTVETEKPAQSVVTEAPSETGLQFEIPEP